MSNVGRWYFRVIETPDGWLCRRGLQELDRHDRLDEALAHINNVARARRPSRVYVHHLDGEVTPLATYD